MRLVPFVLLLVLLCAPLPSFATTVRMHTSLGDIDIRLMDNEAPATVANFLAYVNSGAWVNCFMHRSVPGFVVQGGGFGWNFNSSGYYNVPANPPVVNEFSPARSNKRGTIAMAKLGGNPDSATNQWFFNLADNSANLDNQNGGFTVFGQVIGNGMEVVDAIAAKPIVNAGGPFDSLPLLTTPSSGPITGQHLIIISSVEVLPPPSVAITSPVPGGQSLNVATSTIGVSGTASDNVVSVSWANDRGGEGTANGTQNWSAAGIPLQPGANTISVRVTDAGGDVAVATIVVNYSPGQPQVNMSLQTGGSATTSTVGATTTAQAGYAVGAVSSGLAPYATAVFGFTQNGVVVTEAAVPASPPTTAARIFVDYAIQVSAAPAGQVAAPVDINTGLAIVNPGTAAASVTYTLRNIQGATLATGHGVLAAGVHRARFIDQLQQLAPDFTLPANFASTRWGSLEITADRPISLTALRMTINQRSEALFTTVPVADLTQAAAAAPVFFPHVVDGDGYITTFILLNTSGSVESGTLRFFGNDGAALTVSQAGGSPNSTFRYTIPAGGTYVFQTTGAPVAVQSGSLQLTPDAGNAAPVGAGIFSRTVAGVMGSECGIPSALPTTRALVYVDMANGHDSGLAIANTAATGLVVTLKAYQSDGVTAVGATDSALALPGNGHTAAFVAQWIAGLPTGFRGVVEVASSTPFAALTLRALTNERHDFLMTTFPIADLTRPAPAPPLVFPQIADGGGYRTEFILLSSGGAVSSTMSFFNDEGAVLAVGSSQP
jgi:peptidyl-prolyl cis-trans isomerase A (cyclophilin A)